MTVLIQAQQHNYTYPRYAWIVYGWYPDNWWVSSEPDECSSDDLKIFLDRAFVLHLMPELNNETTDIGRVCC